MHAHTLYRIPRRENFILITILLLFSLVAAGGFLAGTVQSSAKGEGGSGNNQSPESLSNPNGEDIKKDFNDDDLKVKREKPRGQWTFATMLDVGQLNDSSSPVYVSGIQSLSGGGKYLGVTKIKRVEIKNRNSKAVNSVQIRWTIVSLDDPANILSEGTTPFINTLVEGSDARVIEIPTLHPALLLKPLAKDGELYGRFQLSIGVQATRFIDGSFWQRREPVGFLP